MTAERPDPRAPRPLDLECLLNDAANEAIAIGANAADTPSGARLLALAETGAAVERLDDDWAIDRSPDGTYRVDMARCAGSGPSIPEAVAAALEARDDG